MCSSHFEESWFKIPLNINYSGRYLKDGAIPTLNLPKPLKWRGMDPIKDSVIAESIYSDNKKNVEKYSGIWNDKYIKPASKTKIKKKHKSESNYVHKIIIKKSNSSLNPDHYVIDRTPKDKIVASIDIKKEPESADHDSIQIKIEPEYGDIENIDGLCSESDPLRFIKMEEQNNVIRSTEYENSLPLNTVSVIRSEWNDNQNHNGSGYEQDICTLLLNNIYNSLYSLQAKFGTSEQILQQVEERLRDIKSRAEWNAFFNSKN